MTMSAWEDDAPRRATLPSWDAYFSNFIEGTEFTVDEAVAIVYENKIPRGRPPTPKTYSTPTGSSPTTLR